MAFELPPLPYDYSALEPTIDAATMKLHHDMHHGAYVKNLNAAIEKHPELASKRAEVGSTLEMRIEVSEAMFRDCYVKPAEGKAQTSNVDVGCNVSFISKPQNWKRRRCKLRLYCITSSLASTPELLSSCNTSSRSGEARQGTRALNAPRISSNGLRSSACHGSRQFFLRLHLLKPACRNLASRCQNRTSSPS